MSEACLVGNAQVNFTVMADANAKDTSSQWFVFYLLCVSTRDEMLIVFLSGTSGVKGKCSAV